MKSRWTTYVLLVVVLAVWGAVAWKIFNPSSKDEANTVPQVRVQAVPKEHQDTLLCDYPDPFLKGVRKVPAGRPALRVLPKKPAVRRERLVCTHLGTMASGKRVFHILTFEDRQYELSAGESAEGFTLRGYDRDSLYLEKEGVVYGVKRCD